MIRGSGEQNSLDNIERIFQKNFHRRNLQYIKEIEKALLEKPLSEQDRRAVKRGFIQFSAHVTQCSVQSLEKVGLQVLEGYISNESIVSFMHKVILRLETLHPTSDSGLPFSVAPSSSSRRLSGNNLKKVGSMTGSASTSQLPPPSTSSNTSSRNSIGRHDTLLNVKYPMTRDTTVGYTRPSLGREISVQSDDNYYDDDFEASIEDEIGEVSDEEEDEEQRRFFAQLSTERNEQTISRRPSARAAETRKMSNPSGYQYQEDGEDPLILQPKKVNSSMSHDDMPPSSRNYYSSRSQDPQHNSSMDSIDQDHDHRVTTARTSIGTTGALSRLGTADPNQPQTKRRQRNPTWISKRQWRLGEKIGSGSFGEVFQAMNDKGKLFAAKRMNVIDKSLEVDNLLGEIQLMRGLSHKHIVEYLGAFVDTEACFLYIFQEWVPGGSVAHLLKKFGPFSQSIVKNYTRQILLGLQYLHANGIIHRDIKGGNILVDDGGIVKLADFGASTKLSAFDKTQETTTIKGTPYFMAPEVLSASRYGRKGDIWAVGCTMIQMLTGEPPWKDRNLKGLIQLHLLLSSWTQGPPPYSCELSPEGKQCLEMCFRKDENDRPTANDLLQCSFLREDDLEDSHNSSFNTLRSGAGSAFPSQRDILEDSGVLAGLKQEIHKVVTRSMAGLPPYQQTAVEDTMQMIDRRIAEKELLHHQQPQRPNSSSSNPFASKPPNESTPRVVGESIQQLMDKLPSGNNYNDADSTGIAAPKFSRDVPIPTPLSLQQVPNSAANSTGNTPHSSNPYKKGNIAIKNNLPQSGNPFGRDYNSSGSTAEDHRSRANSSPHHFAQPVTTPIAVRSDASTPNVNPASGVAVRDSLYSIKRKANERALGGSSSNTNLRRPSSSSNQSSSRDTEDLTPLPLEEAEPTGNPHHPTFTPRLYQHSEEDEIQVVGGLPRSNSAIPVNPFASHSRSHDSEAKQSFYNTRYYEEKHGLGSASAARETSPLLEEAREEYSSFSSSRKSALDREISVESVADEVGDNYYTKDMNSSNDEVPIRPGTSSRNPFASNTVEDIKVMVSNRTSQSVDTSTGRKYYHPNKPSEETAALVGEGSQHTRNPNIHQAILLKKSSPNTDTSKQSGTRSSPVPALEIKSSRGGAGIDASRRNSDGSSKYAVSSSARIVRPDPVVEPNTRPASSKASFVYQERESRNSSAVSSPGKSASTLSAVSGTSQNLSTASSTPRGLELAAGYWRCGKCSAVNVPNIDYCEKCATRKGVGGDRKVGAIVPRF